MHYLMILLLCPLLLNCTDTREHDSRMAVKSLIAAPESKVRLAMSKVLTFGSYSLPDVEQEFHSALPEGRLRLLDVIERLGDQSAIPFLEFLSRWEPDSQVRQRAKVIAEALHQSRI